MTPDDKFEEEFLFVLMMRMAQVVFFIAATIALYAAYCHLQETKAALEKLEQVIQSKEESR